MCYVWLVNGDVGVFVFYFQLIVILYFFFKKWKVLFEKDR